MGEMGTEKLRNGDREMGTDLFSEHIKRGAFFARCITPAFSVVTCLCKKTWGDPMKLKVIVHEAEEGSYWAEVPSIPGCATQGETFDELLSNIYEAVEGCLSIDVKESDITEKDKVMEIAV